MYPSCSPSWIRYKTHQSLVNPLERLHSSGMSTHSAWYPSICLEQTRMFEFECFLGKTAVHPQNSASGSLRNVLFLDSEGDAVLRLVAKKSRFRCDRRHLSRIIDTGPQRQSGNSFYMMLHPHDFLLALLQLPLRTFPPTRFGLVPLPESLITPFWLMNGLPGSIIYTWLGVLINSLI